MKNAFITALLLVSTAVAAFSQEGEEARRIILISTDLGDMKVALYNETPKHRDNFIKLVESGFYDGIAFHRVIKGFMVQGGDPNTKDPAKAASIGQGGPGYTLPAEIIPGFYHKKGALSAARLGDQQNPERNSSGSQFYVVQGQVWPDSNLAKMDAKMLNRARGQAFGAFLQEPENIAYKERYDAIAAKRDVEAYNELEQEIMPFLDAALDGKVPKMTAQQKKDYTTIGGAPHLDNQYTVFGEVIEGLEVVDKIAAVETVQDRPVKPVLMRMKVIE